MTHTVPPPTAMIPVDEHWPAALRLMLGPDAAGLLQAVADAAGGTLTSWRPRQVNHQPARSTVVQYRTGVRWVAGETTSETFVAATGDRVPAEGAAVFEDGRNRVAVWRWRLEPVVELTGFEPVTSSLRKMRSKHSDQGERRPLTGREKTLFCRDFLPAFRQSMRRRHLHGKRLR